MLTRTTSWTVAAAALFLTGCNSTVSAPPTTTPPITPAITDSYVVTSSNRLVGFNVGGTGAIQISNAITGLAAGETVLDIAFRPRDGLLYGLVTGAGFASPRIVSIDPSTGVASAVSSLAADTTDASAPFAGLLGSKFSIDFNPVPDRLRVVSDSGQNLRINADTGATITDTGLSLNGAGAGASGTAYTNAFNAACRTQQFVVDPATDRLLQQNPPNDGLLTAIGGFGVDVEVVNGFDIVTAANGANTALGLFTTTTGSGDDAVTSTDLYTVSTSTGAATPTATLTLADGETATGFAARAQSRTPAQAPGELVGITADGGHVSFNRGSPSKLCTSGAISGLPDGTDLLGIDTRPATGVILGVGSDNRLYTLSNTGAASLYCALAADPADSTAPLSVLPTGTTFGVGFNPVPDRLRVVAGNGQNLRINPNPNLADQCLVTTDTDISGAGALSGVAYTNSIPAAASTTLYAIDADAGALVSLASPNSGAATSTGSLAIAAGVSNVDAFLIDGRNNSALLAGSAAGAAASTLYTIDLGSGAATMVGAVGGGLGTTAAASLRGLALTTGTTLKVYALTSDNHLLSFSQAGNALTPNAATDLTITGIASGEQLLGIDVRPANGLLHAVSSLNRIYVINTSTGLATLASTLNTSLSSGALFGADFNPTVDRLRVVDNTGSNLRINVGTGATTVDTALSGTGIVAAGYTNSYAGATTTTLYDLDATTLYTQLPPNAGTLNAVGALGVTASGDAGLDIAGGANGLVLAAIRTAGGSGPSDLYRINLATGAATAVGIAGDTAQIGPDGGTQVRSLAIELR